MPVIDVDQLEKRFVVRKRVSRVRRERAEVTAVAGLSFSVAAGEMIGYIGPNGAGKSTTVKMLTGILTPTAGRIRVAGLDPSRDRIAMARRIGVVFGQRSQLWWDLPLRDSFDLLRHVYRVPATDHAPLLADLVDLLDLGPLLDVPVRQLSLGQRMRGDLAAALLHRPEVLYLDEPTIGLDVVSKARVREFLGDLNRARGVTVVLTTHDLADIESLCSRVLVIDHGRLVFDGLLADIKARYAPRRTLVVDLARPEPALVLEGAAEVRADGVRQWITFDRDRTTAARLLAEVTDRVPVVDISLEEPSIDDVVRRIYTEGAGTGR